MRLIDVQPIDNALDAVHFSGNLMCQLLGVKAGYVPAKNQDSIMNVAFRIVKLGMKADSQPSFDFDPNNEVNLASA